MGGNSFRFKRFEIKQEGCAMKVGTDGVLLGAWCRISSEDKQLLDVGSGTGLISLMLAQRTEMINSTISSVEIDEQCCLKAQENFTNSDWSNRIELYQESVQNFADKSEPAIFDHIISNPPYYTNPLISPDAARNRARHTYSLPYKEFIVACTKLLRSDGRISLVLPMAEGEKMVRIASEAGLHISRRTEVWSTPKSGVKRLLLEFTRQEATPELSSLIIEDARAGTFSDEYRMLIRDFYLYL